MIYSLKVRLKNSLFSFQMFFSSLIGLFLLIQPNYMSVKAGLLYPDYSIPFLNLIYRAHAGGAFDLFAPVIAVLPCAVMCYGDEHNFGYEKSVLLRTSRRRYIREHIISSSLTGGAALLIPSALATCLFIFSGDPYLQADVGIYSTIYGGSVLEHIQFIGGGLLVALILLGLSFIFGANCGLTSLWISAVTSKKFLALALPFSIYFFLFLICYRIPGLLILSPVNMLMPDLTLLPSLEYVFIYQGTCCLLLITLCSFVLGRRTQNV